MKHHDIIRKAFAAQAARFEGKGLTLTSAEYLRWMVSCLPLEADFRVLDVATGTGLLARAVAPQVKEVVALDITKEMLQAAQREIEKAGIANIMLQEGLAEEIPYPDNSFDMVVSRLAIHHFAAPQIQVKEMQRACKPGHVVGIIDLLSPPDDDLIGPYNTLERLRDPSHTRALTREELMRVMGEAGLRVCFDDQRDIEVDVERWLDMTGTEERVRKCIKAHLTRDLHGEEETGMRPFTRDGKLMFLQTWGVFVGAK